MAKLIGSRPSLVWNIGNWVSIPALLQVVVRSLAPFTIMCARVPYDFYVSSRIASEKLLASSLPIGSLRDFEGVVNHVWWNAGSLEYQSLMIDSCIRQVQRFHLDAKDCHCLISLIPHLFDSSIAHRVVGARGS